MSQDTAWWEDFFPELFARIQGGCKSPEYTRAEVDRMLEILGLPEGAAVLDVPCGEGRHALELARRGYRVTGVELHPGTLTVAREAAADAGLEVEWIQGDMRELEAEEGFQAAVCYWTSFGYFDDEGDRAFLTGVHRALVPGGHLLMELRVAETLLPKLQPRSWSRVGEATLLEERRYIPTTGRVETDWTLVMDGEAVTRTSSIRLYTCHELLERLEDAGFVDPHLLDGEGRPFELGARRLVLRATRGG